MYMTRWDALTLEAVHLEQEIASLKTRPHEDARGYVHLQIFVVQGQHASL